VTNIGKLAFCNCTGLKKVVLNEGLVSVEKYAFQECHTLESITLPSTVTNINENAFTFCRSLKKVVLNEGLEKIGCNTFGGCESLESITLPSSLVEIGKYGFNMCTNLREVVCIGLPKFAHNTFSGCPTRITFPNLSSRLEDIIQAGQVNVQNKIQRYINQDIVWRRGGAISIPMDAEETRSRDEWNTLKQRFGQIVKWI